MPIELTFETFENFQRIRIVLGNSRTVLTQPLYTNTLTRTYMHTHTHATARRTARTTQHSD